MSAFQYGAPSLSHKHFERQRQAAIEHQRRSKREREIYLQGLAVKLAAECGLSQTVALARVKALSVTANPAKNTEHVRALNVARFG
jgi:hypothetical protein